MDVRCRRVLRATSPACALTTPQASSRTQAGQGAGQASIEVSPTTTRPGPNRPCAHASNECLCLTHGVEVEAADGRLVRTRHERDLLAADVAEAPVRPAVRVLGHDRRVRAAQALAVVAHVTAVGDKAAGGLVSRPREGGNERQEERTYRRPSRSPSWSLFVSALSYSNARTCRHRAKCESWSEHAAKNHSRSLGGLQAQRRRPLRPAPLRSN